MLTKPMCRAEYQKVAPTISAGKLAETVRARPEYRLSKQLYLSPSDSFSQIRINALLDGKQIIMPGPGLKEGFYSLEPFTIPFSKLPFAVTFKGVSQFGRRVSAAQLLEFSIDVLLSEAVAVDRQGVRLGDGTGFFDLSCAILAEYGSLAPKAAIIAVVDAMEKISDEPLPSDPWDVPVQGVITPNQYLAIADYAFKNPQVFWQQIPERKIRKIGPLWSLHSRQ